MTSNNDDWISSFASASLEDASQPSPGATVVSGMTAGSGEYGGVPNGRTCFLFLPLLFSIVSDL
jgi:hypothetical protein